MLGGFAPRFAIEAGFLILLGVGAGYANLRAAVIVALVAGGWLLVSLLEVAVWYARARPVAPTPPPADERELPAEPEPAPGWPDEPEEPDGDGAGAPAGEEAEPAEAAEDGQPKRKRTRRGTRGGRKRRKAATGAAEASQGAAAEPAAAAPAGAGEAGYVPMAQWIEDFERGLPAT